MLRKIFFSPWFWGIIIIFPAIWPFFNPHFFPLHDFTHAARLAEMTQAFQDGQIPPRWSQHLGFGYGMPLFSFYAPLPYYLGVIIHTVGFPIVATIKILFILSFYLSFMVMYFLGKHFLGQKGGLLAATLFIYVPYRALNVYVRGALGELYGILFFTLALLTLTLLVAKPNLKHTIGHSLAFAGILMAHNLIALIGLPFLLMWNLWLLVIYKSKTSWHLIGRLLISYVFGLGLSAFFVFPMFFEKGATSVNQLTLGGGDFKEHFVYLRQLLSSPFGYGGSIAGLYDGISFEIGKIHLGLLSGIILILLIKRQFLPKKLRWLSLGLLGLFGLSVWLTTFHSLWIWEFIAALKYVQFPWRFLSVAMVFASLTAGLLTKKYPRLTFLIMIITIIYYLPIFKPENYLDNDAKLYATDTQTLETKISRTLPDYIHPQLSNLVMNSDEMISPPPERFQVLQNNTRNLAVLENRSNRFTVSLNGTGPFVMAINIFAFPGWTFFVDGVKVPFQLDKALPRMLIPVTSTQNSVIIKGILLETPLRLLADSISLVCGLIMGLLIFNKAFKRHYGS